MAKLLAPISALLLGFWLIATVVSIDHGWASELGEVGKANDVSGEWLSRGTLFSPPLAPLIVQALLTALALRPGKIWQLVTGAGLAVLGALYVVGGLGQPLDPVAFDPSFVAHALLRVTGLVGSVALVVAGIAAAFAAWRGA